MERERFRVDKMGRERDSEWIRWREREIFRVDKMKRERYSEWIR